MLAADTQLSLVPISWEFQVNRNPGFASRPPAAASTNGRLCAVSFQRFTLTYNLFLVLLRPGRNMSLMGCRKWDLKNWAASTRVNHCIILHRSLVSRTISWVSVIISCILDNLLVTSVEQYATYFGLYYCLNDKNKGSFAGSRRYSPVLEHKNCDPRAIQDHVYNDLNLSKNCLGIRWTVRVKRSLHHTCCPRWWARQCLHGMIYFFEQAFPTIMAALVGAPNFQLTEPPSLHHHQLNNEMTVYYFRRLWN